MNEHLDLELSAYLDGDLDGADLARAESHLAACAVCREALDDLRRIVRRAGSLDDRAPERDLWSGISDRIHTPADGAEVVPITRARRRFSFTMPQLAAAAVALMAISAGGAAFFAGNDPATLAAPAVRTEAQLVAGPAEMPIQRAVDSYDAAIAEVERTLVSRRGQLDTATVRVLEQSLAVIDMAIAQASAALADDPNNRYLNQNLQRALGSKLHVLRQVATIPVT